MKKRTLFHIWMAMAFCMLGIWIIHNPFYVKAEESSGKQTFNSEESYKTQSFYDLNDEGSLVYKIQDSSESVSSDISMTQYGEKEGVMVKGETEILNKTRFTIKKNFVFDGGQVGRIAINALASKGKNIQMNLYLDDDEEAFISITLDKQGRSDLWTKSICRNTNMMNTDLKGSHTISFSLTGDNVGETSVLLRTIEFVEEDTPTIYMDIDESVTTIKSMNTFKKVAKCVGTMNLKVPAGYSSEYGTGRGDTDSLFHYELDYMQVHTEEVAEGEVINEEDSIVKDSYEILLEDENTLLGMNSAKKWLLVSSSGDVSLLRNRTLYQAEKYLNFTYAPQCIPVNFVMNGSYYGSYYLTECIDSDQLSSQMNSIITVDRDDLLEDYSIEKSNSADYFWLQQIFCKGNAFSTDLNKLLEMNDGTYAWGPFMEIDTMPYDKESFEGFDTDNSKYFDLFRKDAESVNIMKTSWPKFYNLISEYCKDGGWIDQYYQKVKTSFRYNEEKYDIDCYTGKEELKNYLKGRISWINDNLDQLGLDTCKLTFKADNKIISTKYVTKGKGLDFDLPEIPSKDGYTCQGWRYYDESSKSYLEPDESTTFSSDTIIYAYYVKSTSLVQPQKLFLSSYEMWVSVEAPTDQVFLKAMVYPTNAYTTEVTILSNDEDIAMIDDEGKFCVYKPGTVTFTASCGNLTNQCIVHVYDTDEEDDYPQSNLAFKQASISIKKGTYKQLELVYGKSQHRSVMCTYVSLEPAIVSVDECGVVTGKSAGTGTILVRNLVGDTLAQCKVTVTVPSSNTANTTKITKVKTGTKFTLKGLNYKVISKAKTGGNVALLGPKKKTIKKITIPSTVKYKGESYKVTTISAKAFCNCKKLKKIILGKNIKKIGNKAFKNIYKKAIFKAPPSKKKKYKKLLTSKKGFRRTMKVK